MESSSLFKKKFISFKGLAFDDVLLYPDYSDFKREDIGLETNLTKKIKLKIPFVSSPMDTVTESKLAIALAELGGVGVIHRNLVVQDQIKEVIKVKKKGLLVGAAIGASDGYQVRVDKLIKNKVDFIIVDSAHGFTKTIINVVKFIKNNYPRFQVIAGNVATFEGAQALIKAGVDGIRVGMGPGAICTTRIISGMGVPQITAILETCRAAKQEKVPAIADGGIRYSGDMVKALTAGASTLMMGSYFASCEEAPGEIFQLKAEQIPTKFKNIINKEQKSYIFKTYRGMGSIGAMKKGSEIKSEDEFHGKDYKSRILVAEGVEGLVPVKGTIADIVNHAIGGIKSGMYYVGAKSIQDLHKKVKFMRITQASLIESHPHDILITNPGENYK